MPIFQLFSKNKPKSDPAFAKRLEADLAVCGFSEEIKKGFLFFMGWATPLLDDGSENPEQTEHFISLYSVPSGDFAKYGDLDDHHFTKVLYTANHILHKEILKDEAALDAQLRKVHIANKVHNVSSERIMLKTELDEELVEEFTGLCLKLGPLTTFYNRVFFKLGQHLQAAGYSLKKAYKAGFAYYNMQMHMDIQGARYLISMILDTLPPLYDALRRYPLLYSLYPAELEKIQLLTSTLHYFYSGVPGEIISPIHNFHQIIFYTPGTTELREGWKALSEESFLTVFVNAATIRKSDLYNQATYLQFQDMQMPELKGASIGIDELFVEVQHILWQKHRVNLKKFAHTGEIIQTMGALFYETCLHALVLKDLDYNGSFRTKFCP